MLIAGKQNAKTYTIFFFFWSIQGDATDKAALALQNRFDEKRHDR